MQTQSQLLDVYRSMTRVATETMKASLSSTERLQQQQLQVWRSLLEQNIKSANRLTEAQSLDDVMSAQTQVAGAQLAQAMEVWRGMFRVFGELQTALMSQMHTQVGQATEALRQVYDATARVTEDAAKSAASHVTSIGGTASREAAQQAERAGEPQRKKA
jgi:hypothetical protein